MGEVHEDAAINMSKKQLIPPSVFKTVRSGRDWKQPQRPANEEQLTRSLDRFSNIIKDAELAARAAGEEERRRRLQEQEEQRRREEEERRQRELQEEEEQREQHQAANAEEAQEEEEEEDAGPAKPPPTQHIDDKNDSPARATFQSIPATQLIPPETDDEGESIHPSSHEMRAANAAIRSLTNALHVSSPSNKQRDRHQPNSPNACATGEQEEVNDMPIEREQTDDGDTRRRPLLRMTRAAAKAAEVEVASARLALTVVQQQSGAISDNGTAPMDIDENEAEVHAIPGGEKDKRRGNDDDDVVDKGVEREKENKSAKTPVQRKDGEDHAGPTDKKKEKLKQRNWVGSAKKFFNYLRGDKGALDMDKITEKGDSTGDNGRHQMILLGQRHTDDTAAKETAPAHAVTQNKNGDGGGDAGAASPPNGNDAMVHATQPLEIYLSTQQQFDVDDDNEAEEEEEKIARADKKGSRKEFQLPTSKKKGFNADRPASSSAMANATKVDGGDGGIGMMMYTQDPSVLMATQEEGADAAGRNEEEEEGGAMGWTDRQRQPRRRQLFVANQQGGKEDAEHGGDGGEKQHQKRKHGNDDLEHTTQQVSKKDRKEEERKKHTPETAGVFMPPPPPHPPRQAGSVEGERATPGSSAAVQLPRTTLGAKRKLQLLKQLRQFKAQQQQLSGPVSSHLVSGTNHNNHTSVQNTPAEQVVVGAYFTPAPDAGVVMPPQASALEARRPDAVAIPAIAPPTLHYPSSNPALHAAVSSQYVNPVMYVPPPTFNVGPIAYPGFSPYYYNMVAPMPTPTGVMVAPQQQQQEEEQQHRATPASAGRRAQPSDGLKDLYDMLVRPGT